MSVRALHHIAILCSDREKALDFYCGALGFGVLREHPRPEGVDDIIMLQGSGVMIELFIGNEHPRRPSDPEAYGLRHIALRVTEIENLVGRLVSAGYEPEPIRRDSFSGEKMCFVKDPDGLPVELHE